MPDLSKNVEEGLSEEQKRTLLSKEDLHERCPASHTFFEQEPVEINESVH